MRRMFNEGETLCKIQEDDVYIHSFHRGIVFNENIV